MLINFFTVAFDRYKMFAIPYITAALSMNDKSFVELIVDNPRYFKQPQINFLNKYFRGRWLIREIPNQFKNWGDSKRRKSIRWVAQPQVKARYTYIGDVDIIITDKNLHERHVKHMSLIGKPYSNIVRPNGINMTGLHFVKTLEYYKNLKRENYLKKVIHAIEHKKIKGKALDERLLCRVVKETMGLPDHSIAGSIFRPIHGIHFSLRRPVFKWGGPGKKPANFVELESSEVWKAAYKVFDPRFKQVLNAYDRISLRLAKKDREFANRILDVNTSEEERTTLKQRRSKLRNIKFRFKK